MSQLKSYEHGYHHGVVISVFVGSSHNHRKPRNLILLPHSHFADGKPPTTLSNIEVRENSTFTYEGCRTGGNL